MLYEYVPKILSHTHQDTDFSWGMHSLKYHADEGLSIEEDELSKIS